MEKPMQTKLTKSDDSLLLEAIELAMDDIANAMDNLRGHADDDYEEWFDTLDDMWDRMNNRREELEIIETARYHEEMDELRKEYYRGLM